MEAGEALKVIVADNGKEILLSAKRVYSYLADYRVKSIYRNQIELILKTAQLNDIISRAPLMPSLSAQQQALDHIAEATGFSELIIQTVTAWIFAAIGLRLAYTKGETEEQPPALSQTQKTSKLAASQAKAKDTPLVPVPSHSNVSLAVLEDWYKKGEDYFSGNGVKQDDVQSVYWFQKAAEQGYAPAQKSLSGLYELGRGVAKDETKALFYLRRAVEQGYGPAQDSLAMAYENGFTGVKQDYAQAIFWYKSAAENGNNHSLCSLGYLYECGRGTPQDYLKALDLYRQAAVLGDSYGYYKLGYMYEEGYGVTKDIEQAMSYYRKSAELGHFIAEQKLGEMYMWGHGVTIDYPKAVEWFCKSALHGYHNGYNTPHAKLGYLYNYGGYGLNRDRAQAEYWYHKAAELGDQTAINWLKTN